MSSQADFPAHNDVYPNCAITEDGIIFGSTSNGPAAEIQYCYVDGYVKVKGEYGYHTRVALTVFVNDLTIRGGAAFEVEGSDG